jgi:hypothetical protein
MSSRYLFYAIILVVVVILTWIISDTFTQPGVSDLKGEFEEMVFYRNENNTGPIIRLYAVYSPDTIWESMRSYGEYMPHTKYGNTKVFFFNSRENAPINLSPAEPYFDEKYLPYCTGFYEKSAMGQERFLKYPFR